MSGFRILLSRTAQKNLRKLSAPDQNRALKKMRLLRDYPDCIRSGRADVKKLVGIPGSIYRMRIGTVRILFSVDTTHDTIVIVNVGYRGEIYQEV